MADTKSIKDLRAVLESEGFEIVSAKVTAHVRFDLLYKDRPFTMVTGWNNVSSNRRKVLNFRGDVRRVKKAIDTGDETLLKKYLGTHE